MSSEASIPNNAASGEPPVVSAADDLFSTGPTSDEKLWGMLAQLSSLLGIWVVGMTFLGPLIIWLVKKDTSKFVDYHGKESLNFHLNVLVYFLACIVLIPCFGIGIFLLPAVGIYSVVMSIIAGIKAHEGVRYVFPFIFRLIK